MSKLYNVSSSPHVRSKLTTGIVMYDVILCLLPATVMGIWHFKLQALLVIAASIISAVLAEFVFDYIAHRENTTGKSSGKNRIWSFKASDFANKSDAFLLRR